METGSDIVLLGVVGCCWVSAFSGGAIEKEQPGLLTFMILLPYSVAEVSHMYECNCHSTAL